MTKVYNPSAKNPAETPEWCPDCATLLVVCEDVVECPTCDGPAYKHTEVGELIKKMGAVFQLTIGMAYNPDAGDHQWLAEATDEWTHIGVWHDDLLLALRQLDAEIETLAAA